MSDTKRDVQPQKMARGLKFRNWEVRDYAIFIAGKGADQLSFANSKSSNSHDLAHF